MSMKNQKEDTPENFIVLKGDKAPSQQKIDKTPFIW